MSTRRKPGVKRKVPEQVVSWVCDGDMHLCDLPYIAREAGQIRSWFVIEGDHLRSVVAVSYDG